MNIAVFCSGKGTNLQAIIDAVKAEDIKAQIRLVVGDCKDAYCLKRARNANLKTAFIDPEKFKSRELFEKEIIKYLEEEKIDLVVLAGFMRILSSYFVKKYKNRILNIHPALLPSFKGTQGIKDAWSYGVKVTGVTVHFVDEELDRGPIILQEAIEVLDGDTLDSLERRIHETEYRLYPEAIRLFCENKLKIIGRKVKILFITMAFFASFFISFKNTCAEDKILMLHYSSLPPELCISRDFEHSPINCTDNNLDSFFSEREDKKEDESDGWRPLTEEELACRKKELVYMSAKATAEFFDSIYMPYISKGLFNIIGTAYKIDKYQKEVKEKHGLSIDLGLDDREVYLIYERKY